MKALETMIDAMGRPTAAIRLPPSGDSQSRFSKIRSRPVGAGVVVLSADGHFWCRFDGVAAAPTNDVFDGTVSEYNPIYRALRGVSSISLIAASSRTVGLSFYSGDVS